MNIKEYLTSKHLDSKHNIYIIKVYDKNMNEIIKIGFSNNIIKRLKNYYSHNPFTDVIETLYIENGLIVEQLIHNTIPSIDGTTEWYTSDKYDSIKSIISLEEHSILITKLRMEIDALENVMTIMKKSFKN